MDIGVSSGLDGSVSPCALLGALLAIWSDGVQAMPRPIKLDQRTQEDIVSGIRNGNFIEPACRAAGVSPTTYYRWRQQGEAEEAGPFREFLEAVREAEAAAELRAVAVLQAAMVDDWRAATAYLERRYPQRWGRRATAEPTPVVSTQPDLTKLSADDLTCLEGLLAQLAVTS